MVGNQYKNGPRQKHGTEKMLDKSYLENYFSVPYFGRPKQGTILDFPKLGAFRVMSIDNHLAGYIGNIFSVTRRPNLPCAAPLGFSKMIKLFFSQPFLIQQFYPKGLYICSDNFKMLSQDILWYPKQFFVRMNCTYSVIIRNLRILTGRNRVHSSRNGYTYVVRCKKLNLFI